VHSVDIADVEVNLRNAGVEKRFEAASFRLANFIHAARNGHLFPSSRAKRGDLPLQYIFSETFGQLACPVPRGGFAPGRRYDHEYDSRRAGLEALNTTKRRDPGMLPIRRLVVNIK